MNEGAGMLRAEVLAGCGLGVVGAERSQQQIVFGHREKRYGGTLEVLGQGGSWL